MLLLHPGGQVDGAAIPLRVNSFPPQVDRNLLFHVLYALGVCHPNTRTYVGLLGPCFKTGRLGPLCRHLKASRVNFNRALHI